MKYFSMESLNRKALNKITMLHKMILNHSSELGNGFDLPLCREKNGAELSSKDFETLFGTYNFWRISNGLSNLSYITKLFEVGNISTTEKSVSVETFTIRVGSMALSVTDFEPCTDIPSEFAKRDGKSEKAKTAENNAKKDEEKKTVAEAKQIVAEAKTAEVTAEEAKQTAEVTAEVTAEEEIKNKEKAMQRKADALNADTVATIFETTIRRIGLILGVKWEDMDKKQKNAIKDALTDHVKMLENGSVM